MRIKPQAAARPRPPSPVASSPDKTAPREVDGPASAAPPSSVRSAPPLPDDAARATVGHAGAIAQVQGNPALRAVPTVADLEGLRAGTVDVQDVESRLQAALLSSDPRVVKKAARTLQVAESYRRKARQDEKNYAGTGFKRFAFPKLRVKLDANQTQQAALKLAQTRDPTSVNVLLMASKRGLVRTEPKDAFRNHPQLRALRTPEPAQLPGSEGKEAPRGADSFQEEWTHQVVPGLENIEQAIIQTAKANGASCPYAQGNHAKGIAFDNASFKLDDQAPDWARDLFGDSLTGGMVRISGSQTDRKQSDQASHMPGIRIAFPIGGKLDGSAPQLIDLTANTGSTTHAQTAREHTQFTKDISVPKGPISGLKPVRAAKHALGALFGPGKVSDRIDAMKNAVEVTDMAMEQRFHEHKFFGRHAFFVGGRYVQVRFEVVEPKNFKDPNQNPDDPNARLNATAEGIAKGGLKLAMFMTELPDGNPDMVEQEGWTGLPETRLATISLPPQTTDPHSAASKWFEDVPHVPGGDDKVFNAVGLGRHRIAVYEKSGKVRHRPRAD